MKNIHAKYLLPYFFLFAISSHGLAEEFDVWVGTDGKHGVYHLKIDTQKGRLTEPQQVANQQGAGFLAVDSNGNNLYVTGQNKNGGCVFSYSIQANRSGEIAVGRSGVSNIPNGHHPTHISLDRTEKFIMTAQYGGGSVAVFNLDENGAVENLTSTILHKGGSRVFKNRQDSPHPHWIGIDMTNTRVAVPDLGLDQVVTYDFDSTEGTLTAAQPWSVPPGSGPRHMKFHENGKFAYVLNEFTMSVSVFELDGVGQSRKTQEIKSLPDELRDHRLNTCAEVRIHPNGKYLYTSNRGHDSITVFEIDQGNGTLSFVQREAIRGSWPRNFAVSPDGKWLLAAGKFSNTLSLFEVSSEGKLEFARIVKNIPRPICVAFSQTAITGN